MSAAVKTDRERTCYNALSAVLREDAYSAQALDEALNTHRRSYKDKNIHADEDEFVTRLFYGVLEKNVTLEYILGQLVRKNPKPAILIILKMGVYMIRYMSTPDYAVVDRCVELAKMLGKSGASGFINAVLRKAAAVSLPVRSVGDVKYLSVNYGLPEWLAGLFVKEYGFEFTENMMKAEEFRTHIRLGRNVDVAAFEKALSEYEDLSKSKTKYGYYVTHNTLKCLISNRKIPKFVYAVQSLASMIATRCYARDLKCGDKVLDLCAAPGGKAVYLAELSGSEVTACDIHEHRCELIKSYAKRMNVYVETVQNDACVEKEEWIGKYDCAVCDVPCSGTGDLRSRPDILLRRTPSGVRELSALQSRILRQAAKYVKIGGKLCYSTCSLLEAENENVIEDFLKHHCEYELVDCSGFGAETGADGTKDEVCAESSGGNVLTEGETLSRSVREKSLKILPHVHHTDGFFVCVMRKTAEGEI